MAIEVTDAILLEVGLFIIVYVVFFVMAVRVTPLFNLLGGIAAIFLGVRVFEILDSLPLGILIITIGVFTILSALFAKIGNRSGF